MSAETLSEMKGWVADIKTVLQKIKQRKDTSKNKPESSTHDIKKEDSIKRSNSASTLLNTTKPER